MKKKLFSLLSKEISMKRIREQTVRLHSLEKSVCHRDFRKSTQYCEELLREAGLREVKRYALSADGKTAYMDCVMPQAWDRTGRCFVRVESPSLPEKDRMLADTDAEPLCGGIWSAPTPKGGIDCEIVDFEALPDKAAPDVKGKLVLVTNYNQKDYRLLTDAGASGLLICDLRAAKDYPDFIRWGNGIGFQGWYHTADDKRNVIFHLTPRKTFFLRELLSKGPVRAHAEMNTRIYDGEIYTVTGILPGTEPEEITLFAHLYEPFLPDDSAGAVCSAEICRALRRLVDNGKLPPLRKTVRVVFSMELFGFSEYLLDRERNRRTLYVMSMDSICHKKAPGKNAVRTSLRRTADCTPFFSDLMLRDLLKQNTPHISFREDYGNFSDDTFCSDPMIGIPSNWLVSSPPIASYHHNTGPQFMDADWDMAHDISAIAATLFATLATGGKEIFADLGKTIFRLAEKELKEQLRKIRGEWRSGRLDSHDAAGKACFLTEVQEKRVLSVNRFLPANAPLYKGGQIREFRELCAAALGKIKCPAFRDLSAEESRAANRIVIRLFPGIPHSFARIPVPERYAAQPFCEALIYGFFDGKRTLLDAIRCVEYDTGRKFGDAEIKKALEQLSILERCGYVKISKVHKTTPAELEKELRALGVARGDKVVIHTAFSALGDFKGGPEAFCETCMKLIGKLGVILMPTFNFYTHDRSSGVYDPDRTPSYTGAASEAFRKRKDVYRSLDPSHPVCAWGKDALEYVRNHHKVPTMDADSPLGLLERNGGKVLLISCPGANTFMHVVETTNQVRCLGQRMEEYKLKLRSGKIVPARTWAWRDGICPAYNPSKIYDFMRRKGTLKERMFRNAHLMLFDMSDYRKAYETFLFSEKTGCRHCKIRPRKNAFTVKSDWDEKKHCLKKTAAYVGDCESREGNP
ncbi:MAG: SPBc2 prophage-derived aminoglycoside N(3')-acetyltransferase-like protein YokD [Lentisphaerae bacterium ADurb.Bin242]|nr:MAG: SPBc2 prophage-derived aminoglycoside N(3')-acetyltransferase-like protein YokD [Lentisphaerae bacterium ADurb.Bin242]